MKATDLDWVIRWFDPAHALSGDELSSWFVQREHTPRARMGRLLITSGTPEKILLVGHRGTGKTTELRKLAEEIKDDFATINFDPTQILGAGNLEYEDVMLTIGTQVMQYCIREDLVSRTPGDHVRDRLASLRDWWARIVAGLTFEAPASEFSIGVQLTTVLGQVEAGSKQSSLTREEIKIQINRQMPELLNHLNWIIDQAQRTANRRLLIVVEGLDKVDLDVARKIFRDHATTITSPACSMIYTFPLALRHADDWTTIMRGFPAQYFLPNIAAHHRDGSPNQAGVEVLRQMVLERMEEHLIEPDALDLIVEASGGIPVWLITLVRSAALFAPERQDGNRVAVADALDAVRELRRELSGLLTREELEVLRARQRDRDLTNDEIERRLLYKGALIDYANGETWCDAHPALKALLRPDDGRRTDGGAGGADRQ